MGQSYPKHPKYALDRTDQDRVNDDEAFPDEDNVQLDHNDALEQFYVAYSTVTFQLRNLTKYDIDEETYQECDKQRGDIHYFKMKNILENYDGPEIFIKVMDFSNTLQDLSEVNPFSVQKMKINKRLIKEMMLLDDLTSKFLEKPLGYFNIRRESKVYVIFEYAPKRIHDIFISGLLGPFINKLRLLRNLLDVIMYLHINGIISYDISPYSFGVSNDMTLKLLTFGNSIQLTGQKLDVLRESWFDRDKFDWFTAPEIYFTKPLLKRFVWSSDIWSLGIIMYCMFRNDYAKHYESFDETFQSNEEFVYDENRVFNSEKFWEIFDMKAIDNPFIKSLIASMLKSDFMERPNIFEVCDNFNRLTRILNLSEDFEIVYHKSDVLKFTEIYDPYTHEIIVDNKKK